MEHHDKEQHVTPENHPQAGYLHHPGEPEASATSLHAKLLSSFGLDRATNAQAVPLEQLISDLNNSDWQVRLTTIRTIGLLGEQAPLEFLLKGLEDKHSLVRAAAVQALGKTRGRAPIHSLMLCMNDEDAAVRAGAVWALSALGENVPLEPLLHALHDAEWSVREAAALALGELGERTPSAPLLAACQDNDGSVREAAELALQQREKDTISQNTKLPYARLTRLIEQINVLRAQDLTPIDEHDDLFVDDDPTYSRVESGANSITSNRRHVASKRSQFTRLAEGSLIALVVTVILLSSLLLAHKPDRATNNHLATPPGTPATLIYRGHSEDVSKVRWLQGGATIISAGIDGTVQIWDANSGRTLRIYRGPSDNLATASFSPDASLVADALSPPSSADWTIRVWNLQTGATILTIPILNGGASILAWSPDGKRIAFDVGDDTIQVWNIKTGRMITTYTEIYSIVNTIAWSPDGTRIASGGHDGVMEVWDASTGQTLFSSANHPSPQLPDIKSAVTTVGWSPNGKHLASATADGTIQVWDTVDKSLAFVYHDPFNWSSFSHYVVTAMAWSPDGTQVASANSDGSVEVWNTLTAKWLFTQHGHTQRVNDVAWSPDGLRIASASSDGTIQVWPVPPVN